MPKFARDPNKFNVGSRHCRHLIAPLAFASPPDCASCDDVRLRAAWVQPRPPPVAHISAPANIIPITPLPISTAAPSYETVIALPLIARCIGIRSCRCRPAHPYHKAAWLRPLAIPTYDSGNRRSQARWHTAEPTTFAMTARLRSRGRSISQTTPSELWPQTLKPRPRYPLPTRPVAR